MGVYGEILCLLSDQAEILLEITSDKKVIAKKPLTNLYEMNSRLYVYVLQIPESKLFTYAAAVNALCKTYYSL